MSGKEIGNKKCFSDADGRSIKTELKSRCLEDYSKWLV